jgi:hypothetical protein
VRQIGILDMIIKDLGLRRREPLKESGGSILPPILGENRDS